MRPLKPLLSALLGLSLTPTATAADLSELSDVAASNMKALFALLDRIKPEERMLRAELARELGRFPEALGLLKFAPFGENYAATASQIRELAQQNKAGVAEVKGE